MALKCFFLMWYEFADWLNVKFGWIVGTQYDLKQARDKAKPIARPDETKAEFARRTINLSKSFNRRYWLLAKIRRTLIVLIIIMALTNPSHSAFISFEKSQLHYPEILCGRKYNFFIFSVYQARNKKFIAVFGNFFAQKTEEES